MNNSANFEQCIFWLYYARGLLQSKLKHYNDAISSFTASIDNKNYAQLLNGRKEFATEELTNHKQVLHTAERTIANKSNSSADIAIKANSVKLAEKYQQVINYFEGLLQNNQNTTELDFTSMFDVPVSEYDNQNTKIQYGYAHYHKGLNQIAIDKKKDAVESFNIANKLMPYFPEPFIQKAQIFKEQKQFKKALVQYDAAIQLESDNAELYFARSTLLFELGKTDEAKNDFNRYQQLQSDKTSQNQIV